MPMLDKPLSQLKQYMGITPCPDDFDLFWDEKIAIAKAADKKYTLERTSEVVQPDGFIIEDMYFTAMDGSEIYAEVCRPDDNEKHPVLLEFHGLGGSVGDYTAKLKWAALGAAVISMDCRSQAGKSSDNTPRKGGRANGHIVRGAQGGRDNLYYVSVFTDIVQLVEIVKGLPFVNADKMAAHGGSQGGALTVVCAALCADDIKWLTPCYPFLCDYKRLYEMDQMERAYQDLKDYIRAFIPEDGERDEFWTLLGYIDLKNMAKRIKGEVLWYTGLMDNICPPSTQFAAYNRIVAPKEMYIASNYGHETPRQWWDVEFNWLYPRLLK